LITVGAKVLNVAIVVVFDVDIASVITEHHAIKDATHLDFLYASSLLDVELGNDPILHRDVLHPTRMII
jgi:hypothetical protein